MGRCGRAPSMGLPTIKEFPDEEGTETPRAARRRNALFARSKNSPMRRGLKRGARVVPHERLALRSKNSPMRRGLKHQDQRRGRNIVQTIKEFPDEEGTETSTSAPTAHMQFGCADQRIPR